MAPRTTEVDGVPVLLLDAIGEVPADPGDFVLITGAHAGLHSARQVLRRPPRLAIFSDAGVGKDRAGVAGLEMLDGFNIPAAAVDVHTARIGDAADTLANGVISHCNKLAEDLGVVVGESVKAALAKVGR